MCDLVKAKVKIESLLDGRVKVDDAIYIFRDKDNIDLPGKNREDEKGLLNFNDVYENEEELKVKVAASLGFKPNDVEFYY